MEYTITKSENLAEIEVSYKTKVKASERPKITDAEDAVVEVTRKIYERMNMERKEQLAVFAIIVLMMALIIFFNAITR